MTQYQRYHFIFLFEKSAMSDKSMANQPIFPQRSLLAEKKLQENYVQGKPVFVFLHQPLFTNSVISKLCGPERTLYNISKNTGKLFFSGHLHLALGSKATVRHDVFTIYNASSQVGP